MVFRIVAGLLVIRLPYEIYDIFKNGAIDLRLLENIRMGDFKSIKSTYEDSPSLMIAL